MKAFISTVFLSFFAVLDGQAQSSLCVPGAITVTINRSPQVKFFWKDFFDQIGDLQYIPGDKPYASLYVSSSQLNVRDAPNGNIVGKVFKGQRVFVYARRGNWLAIRMQNKRLWVHQGYLRYTKRGAPTLKELKDVCSFKNMSLMLSEDVKTPECQSVAAYVAWNNGDEYKKALGEYMGERGKGSEVENLANCRYQLFQSSVHY